MPPTHHAPAVHSIPQAERASIASVLTFWFDHKEPMRVWFGTSPAFDASIKKAFAASMDAAARGELDHWQASPQGALALLILLDQFPRNVYRGDGRAFAADGKALGVALRAIAQGYDLQVPFLQQVFFYLPLEHDEDLRSQVACVALVRGLLTRAQPQEQQMAQAFYDFALRHQATVLAYGRYPSRNAALRRASTAAEEAFLKEHPTGF